MNESYLDQLKANCNFYLNGNCWTTGCLSKGNLPRHLVGCPEYQVIATLAERDQTIAALKAEIQRLNDRETIRDKNFFDEIDRLRAQLEDKELTIQDLLRKE